MLRLILDNHSAHTSKEAQRYLATRPSRFQFVFVPKHGSWLLISKMTRAMLREITAFVCIFKQLNADPVVFRWKYKMDEVSVA